MDLEKLRIDRGARTPTRRRRGKWPGRLVLLVVLGGLAFLFRAPLTAFVDRVRLPLVRTARAEKANPAAAAAARGKAANGYVVAARRAALSADAPGRIVELNVREGSVVHRGDVVARLYSEELAAAESAARAEVKAAVEAVARAAAQEETMGADVARLRRQVEAAVAGVDAAEARVAQRRADLERAKSLAGNQVLTRSDLDDAQAACEVAEADARSAVAAREAALAAVTTGEAGQKVAGLDVRIASARLEAARAQLGQASAMLDKTIVRAPFDGIVVLKDAEVGEVVSPYSQGGSNARGSVATMVDLASLEVQANVAQTSLDAVVLGAPVKIYLDAWPERAYEGRVDRIWPTADRQKGTIEVRVAFLLPDERLRPELGARVVFLPPGETAVPQAAARDGLIVPEEAVVTRDGQPVVFVLDGDRVQRRPVTVAERQGGRAAVSEGLADGEVVVLEPSASLSDGDRVRTGEGRP
jgi:RND family efflux transporter MFP subunit